MRALTHMDRIQISNEMIVKLLSLYESKGKNFYYTDLFKRDEQAFIRNTIEEDMVSICAYLKFDLTDARMKWIAKKEFTPKNKEEALLYNIKLSLTQIQNNKDGIEFYVNEVDNLIRQLSKASDPITFKTYQKPENEIISRGKTASRKDDLESLFRLFEKNLRGGKFELIQLITNFYVDFINMEILTEHNELVALLLLYAMLSKYFKVFNYISFFKQLVSIQSLWESALTHAKYYWSSSYAQTDLLSNHLIEILIKIYAELDQKAHEYAFEIKLNKSNSIENTILKIDSIFSKEDIRTHHPTVSLATIDRTLKELKDRGVIRPIGKGRSSKWERLAESRKKTFQQMTIFDE